MLDVPAGEAMRTNHDPGADAFYARFVPDGSR